MRAHAEPVARRRRWLIGLATAVVALSAPSVFAAPGLGAKPHSVAPKVKIATSASAARVGHVGRWFVDGQGRVLIFHGGNVVAKGAPYAPASFGFDEADAAYAQSLGFNAVRLGVMWSGAEPRPGVYDEAYLDSIARTQQLLWKHGIYSLLDSHQDFYNKRYEGNGGDGAPDWAVVDPDASNPVTGTTGTSAWQSFWDNAKAPDGVGLQDHFAAMWRHVAKRFRGLPGVVGIDIINEPPAGSPHGLQASPVEEGAGQSDEQVSCLKPILGCPEFDTNVLAPFYRKVIGAIRTVDAKTIVNYEPNGTWQFGCIPSWIPYLGDPNLAFSYHPYVSETNTKLWGPASAALPGALPATEDEYAQQVADRNDAPAWIGEIGAGLPTSDLADADRSMQGYLYWTFWSANADGTTDSSSTIKDPKQPPSGANINAQDVTDYARPYPRAIAGTPTGWSFDTSSRAFTFTYSSTQPDGRRGRALTEVDLPSSVYANGYTVTLTGATLAPSSMGGQLLHIRANPDASTVHLTVTPK